jgi:hypothetical protein
MCVHRCLRDMIDVLCVGVGVALLVFAGPRAAAQCGLAVSGRYGGETSAVAVVTSNRIAVGRGSVLELYQTANPLNPLPMSPPRRILLPAPAVKIAMTPNAPRMFILTADGRVTVGTVSYAPSVSVAFPTQFYPSDAVDIAADGQFCYVISKRETEPGLMFPYVSSTGYIFDMTSGVPVLRSLFEPLLDGYGYDKIVKIGNILWCGMHEVDSSIYGLEGWDVSNPAQPVRVTTSLNNVPLGQITRVTSMANVNGRLLMSYVQDSTAVGGEDWMRAVTVSNPSSIVWHTPVDLNGDAQSMAADGTRLRIAIRRSGVGTWETSNPNALAWLGAWFDVYMNARQMVCLGGGTDYWAGAYNGLMCMNVATPSAPLVQTVQQAAPLGPSVVRQRGNTTVTLDYSVNSLRIMDYTLPEAQQLRSSYFLPLNSYGLELAELAGGTIGLACVRASALGGDSITIIDITNPAAPTFRSTISTGANINLMSAFGSRLYVHTSSNRLMIYELASPTAPALRSSTQYGGSGYDFRCMTSWNNAVALGHRTLGLWLIDTTNATSPIVSSVYNPASGYSVYALAKGSEFLFVSATATGSQPNDIVTRLESLTVTNLVSPTRRFVHTEGLGLGALALFRELTVVENATDKFLVAVQTGDIWSFGEFGKEPSWVWVFSLPPVIFAGRSVPFPIAHQALTNVSERAAVNGDGTRFFFPGDAAGLYQLTTPVQWEPGFGLVTHNLRVCHTGQISLIAAAAANPTPTVQWYFDPFDGPEIMLSNGPTGWGSTVSGVNDTFGITISNVHRQDARGRYVCRATNSCGSTDKSFRLALCAADFNCTNALTVQDVFDFLTAWFNGTPSADYNGVAGITVQDIFDFLTDWFFGCTF